MHVFIIYFLAFQGKRGPKGERGDPGKAHPGPPGLPGIQGNMLKLNIDNSDVAIMFTINTKRKKSSSTISIHNFQARDCGCKSLALVGSRGIF